MAARSRLRVNPRLILAAAGGEASDAAAVRGHAGENRHAAGGGGMRRTQNGAIFDDGAGLPGAVSTDALRKRSLRSFGCSPEAKPVPSGAAGNPGGQHGVNLHRKALRSNEPVRIKGLKRESGMNAVAQQKSGNKTVIRPFQVDVPEAKIAKLRNRIDATEWPDRETVADESHRKLS